MQNKLVTWSFTVECVALVQGDADSIEILEIFARDVNGNMVQLAPVGIDVRSEIKAMTAEGILSDD